MKGPAQDASQLSLDADHPRTKRRNYERDLRGRHREQDFASGTPFVTCKLCGKRFQFVSATHMKSRHGTTLADYIERFPSEPLVSTVVAKARGRGPKTRALAHAYQGRDPDARLLSFLTGSLLGDGSLEKCAGKLARYAEGGSHEEYLRWKHRVLADYFPTRIVERVSAPHVKSGKRYRGWWVRTASHTCLTDMHDKWYHSRKGVPRDLVAEHLDDLALAVWFCDDGHRSKHGAYIYTMAFQHDDVAWLAGLLLERFGLVTNIRMDQKGKPFIYVRACSVSRLDAIINKLKIPGMAYKCGRTSYE